MPDGTVTLHRSTIGYDRRGGGPPLLLIPGGSGDAGVFGPFAERLAEAFDVVGMYGRVASQGGADADQRPADHAEDALGLLDALVEGPAFVFGSSSGAVTALELAVRHPERVRLAVVHEAPMTRWLPDAEARQGMFEQVRETARTGGTGEAMAVMAAGMAAGAAEAPVEVRRFGDWYDGYAETAPEPPAPELAAVFARLRGLQPAFLEHLLVPFAAHAPNEFALQANANKLVPAAGVDSRGQLPYRSAAALAERIGAPLTEFPGGHLGPVERPALFARALTRLLHDA
ncbi:alpha/beta hydrolase [Glycomyces sp. A-F 0318]|uniref:alpha/beta fold hydrolase n=1 Tax=Glycomyces amatae TaxID=2881355 RepID=UPI001E543642|nr:alpha/beta hydrolase [Glycomyces amatae]MCD0444054.1 alpha/beta hydrolase [Glycomyces amatae]